MTTSEIIKIIKQKIKEHEEEMKPTYEAVQQLKKELTKKNKSDIVGAAKLMSLKDKFVFHKTCKMVLEDLLEEVNVTD